MTFGRDGATLAAPMSRLPRTPWFFLLLGAAACAPEPPLPFHAASPANPAAKPAARPSVAAVLEGRDPLAARVCAKGLPCVLPEEGAAPKAADPHAGHHNHHH